MVLPDETDTDNYIRELGSTVERQSMEILSLKEHNTALSVENESLKRKLLMYENPHTPPSRQMFPPKITNPPGKRGVPKGHRGATHVPGKQDEINHVTADTCPRCNHSLGSPVRMEKRTIFDIPPPQKVVAREFDVDVYRCSSCDIESKAQG